MLHFNNINKKNNTETIKQNNKLFDINHSKSQVFICNNTDNHKLNCNCNKNRSLQQQKPLMMPLQ